MYSGEEGLNSRVHTQLPEYPPHVELHSFLPDHQALSNLLVCPAGQQKLINLRFAGGQRGMDFRQCNE